MTNGSMTGRRCFCFCRGSAFHFFWRRRIGAMADHRHHGEGEHHQRNVAMPSMPGSALVVIEPELVFRGLKTVLDRPPMAFDRHQRFDGCSRWTPGAEEGEITIGDISTDQQTSRPKTMICAVKFRHRDVPIRDSTNHAAAVLWLAAPADRRFHSDAPRVRAMSAALPATDRRLPQD